MAKKIADGRPMFDVGVAEDYILFVKQEIVAERHAVEREDGSKKNEREDEKSASGRGVFFRAQA